MSRGASILLPGTDLIVSRLCLGGNRFGGGLDEAAGFAVLDAFREAGGSFIDTAHIYTDWIPEAERSSSEKMIGRWLRDRRPEGLVVATKGGHPPLDRPTERRLDADSLRRDVAESITFLGVERLDLFYLHRDDPDRPVGDILETLESLRREGLIRAYAASNWLLERLAEARVVARAEGWQGFTASQAEWSLAERNPATRPADLVTMDAAMTAAHRLWGMAAIPYSAQAKGYFDKVAAGALDDASPAARLYDGPESRVRAGLVNALAAETGASATQIALAALLHAPFVTVPVIGCGTPAQVKSSMAALQLDIPAERLDVLWAACGWEAGAAG